MSADIDMIVGSLNFAMDDKDGRYMCPEKCGRSYHYRWIKRHLVSEHGWQYYDGENVYRAAGERNE